MSSVASASPVPTSASVPSRPSALRGVDDHGRDAGRVERRVGAAAGEVGDRRDDVAVARVERVRGPELERELAAAGHRVDRDRGLHPEVDGGHQPGEPDAAGAEDDERRAGGGLEHVEDGAGARLDPAPERRGDREVEAAVDLHGVTRVRERVRREARLAEEVAVHGRVAAAHRGRAVRPHADGVELAEALAVGDVAGAAAVAARGSCGSSAARGRRARSRSRPRRPPRPPRRPRGPARAGPRRRATPPSRRGRCGRSPPRPCGPGSRRRAARRAPRPGSRTARRARR